MATMNAFDSYTVRIYGGATGRVALMLCYNSSAFIGRIDFYPDGVVLPQDYLWHPTPSGEYVVLHMPMSRFESVMSTVRQETPLHLYIDVNRGMGALTQGHGHLATTEKEPVGEEEGTPLALSKDLNLNVKWVDNVASLRSTQGSKAGTIAILGGYWDRGDGGGGLFYWDHTLVPADDNGGTVIAYCTGTEGGWVRLYSGPINVKWFGAKGDDDDDSTAIRDALAAVPTDGAEIFFPPGTYVVALDETLGYVLNLPSSNITIRGSGRVTTIIKLKDLQTKFARIFTATGKSDIVIRDLTIDGNKDGQKLEVCQPPDDPDDPDDPNENACEQQHAIFLNACTNAVVENVHIKDTRGDGICWYGDSGSHCVKPIASGCYFEGIDRAGINVQTFKDAIITGCHFLNSNGSVHIKAEPDNYTQVGQGITITGCTFNGNANSHGICLSGINDNDQGVIAYTTDIAISGNSFRGLSAAVFLGVYSQGWTISDNIIEDCIYGICSYCDNPNLGYSSNSHITISGNTLRHMTGDDPNNGQYPILLACATGATIIGNTIEGTENTLGICLKYVKRATIQGNTVIVGKSGEYHQAYGINVYWSDEFAIVGNVIQMPSATTNYRPGIYINDNSNYPTNRAFVAQNAIYGSPIQGIAVQVESDNAVAVGLNYAPTATTFIDWFGKKPAYPEQERYAFNGKKVTYGTAKPTSGTWAVGDEVINTSPSAGGYRGWIWVAPGEWKGYGTIES